MKEKAPAFQFYPKDWLSDGKVRAMGHEARGVYIDLLSIYWNDGGLPSDLKALAGRVSLPLRTFQRLWPLIAPCFGMDGDSLTSKRLDREKVKQSDYRSLQQAKGLKSAKSRVSAKTDQPRLDSVGTSVQPNFNSPFPSPSASSTEQEPPSSSVDSRTDADDAREEVSRALDAYRAFARSTATDQEALDGMSAFHAPSGPVRLATCTNVNLLRVTASKIRAFIRPKPPKARKVTAPAWDLGLETTATDEELTAWDPRLGPAPKSPEPEPEAPPLPTRTITVATGSCPDCGAPVRHSTESGQRVVRCSEEFAPCGWAAVWREVVA